MAPLHKKEIEARLARTDEARIVVDPLLDPGQVGELTLDLRLGYDFLVSVLTRKSFIGVSRSDPDFRNIGSYFQPTRREIGDRFLLYPGQLVLATTLEYIGLPSDVYADVLARSSYLRLGIHLNTMVQPGYRGCFPLELVNHGTNPVELIVGSRMVQARFMSIPTGADYHATPEPRKYFAHVRPIVSRASEDKDVELLDRIRLGR